jgi:hypothetical protein
VQTHTSEPEEWIDVSIDVHEAIVHLPKIFNDAYFVPSGKPL